MNRLELSGRLLELGTLRHTPGGLAAIDFKVVHESEQDEAGGRRKVSAEIAAVAFEAQARLLAVRPLGAELKLQGFLAAKSRRSKRLILHVTNIEFSQGKETQDAPAPQR
ncbi:MAG TPA: primosomal replication protein N [Burkholderiales bacterium]|nr:primosomal replication protein N [Burkholderiales bacterium]